MGARLQDSFQQHDVQELCRVLFDALESTFQGTVNEKLVNDLYQGESVTWGRCLVRATGTLLQVERGGLGLPSHLKPRVRSSSLDTRGLFQPLYLKRSCTTLVVVDHYEWGSIS